MNAETQGGGCAGGCAGDPAGIYLPSPLYSFGKFLFLLPHPIQDQLTVSLTQSFSNFQLSHSLIASSSSA